MFWGLFRYHAAHRSAHPVPLTVLALPPMPKLIRCKKSLIWLPDEYLTSIVGSCDRGRFTITRRLEMPAQITGDGRLYMELEHLDQEPLALDETLPLEDIACAKCSGPVEMIEVNPHEILEKIRNRELDMKRAATERESRRQSQTPPPATP